MHVWDKPDILRHPNEDSGWGAFSNATKKRSLMKTNVFLSIFLFLALSLLFSWVGADVTAGIAEAEHDALTELQLETFSLLQEKFPRPILDRDFETLRKLVSDDIYLDFLRRSHPTDEPAKTFEEFFQTALPPAERYLRFWRKHVEDTDEIDAEALAALHKLVLVNWHMLIRDLHGEKPNFDAMLPFFTDEEQENPFAPFVTNGELSAGRLANILMQMVFFAAETQEADAENVKALIDTYGEDRGLVWLALREPILLGKILLSFTETDIFLRWIDGEFDRKKKRSKD